MLRPILGVFAAGVGLCLCGCATPPEVFGPLTAADVREITSVVQQRSDVRKPILRIDADGPTVATITTGRDDTAGDRMNTFQMSKQAGLWRITSSIEEEKIIVTSADAHRLH